MWDVQSADIRKVWDTMSYIQGKHIRELRERKKYTQKQLADSLNVSEKTVSKWENDRGLPDISLLESLAETLQVSVAELFNGQCNENKNVVANMRRSSFYVCPVCGNVLHTMGEGTYSCCGILLPVLSVENEDAEHEIKVENMDGEYYVTVNHPMEKGHFISFIAYVTSDRIQLVKLYPEQSAEARFRRYGRGDIYAYCNRHGLYKISL